jgi:hypothetical protein
MWCRLTYIRGHLSAAFTDILRYQIYTKIASRQDQQPVTPASTQATCVNENRIYPKRESFEKTIRINQGRDESREGIRETIYLPYADDFLHTYGPGMVFIRYLTIALAVESILQIHSFTPV